MTIKRKTRVDLNNTADKAGAKDILCVTFTDELMSWALRPTGMWGGRVTQDAVAEMHKSGESLAVVRRDALM